MSTDWYLLSPSHKKKEMVGSIGLSGVQVWGTAGFLRWAIEEHVTDVVLVNEHDQRLEDDDIVDFPS